MTEIPFDHINGNCLGFARERSIAVNPINPLPHKTRFHELAHVPSGALAVVAIVRGRAGRPALCSLPAPYFAFHSAESWNARSWVATGRTGF